MKYKTVQKLNSKDFKRFTGVQKPTFKMMLKAWDEYHVSQSNAGRPSKLNRSEQLLVALQYWREYRSYFHIAQDWNVSEATVCRIVHRVEKVLMNSGRFRLPGKKQLTKGFGTPDVILIDVTETPIERPKRVKNNITREKRNNIPSNVRFLPRVILLRLFACSLVKVVVMISTYLRYLGFIFIQRPRVFKTVDIRELKPITTIVIFLLRSLSIET